MKTKFVVLLGILLYAWTATAAENLLYFKSDPGDSIGGGQEILYTAAEIDFVATWNFANAVSFAMNNFGRPSPDTLIWWYADFAAPFEETLAAGAYENATRSPFQAPEDPGLSISGDGRGCNTLTGRFDVKEAVYDASTGEVIRFAVDFEQHCEGASPALFGAIRFNSDVPIPTLLPPRITLRNPLNAQGCLEASSPGGAAIELVAASSQGDSSNGFGYDWSISTGETGAGRTFAFDLGVGQSAAVLLVMTDSQTGETASSSQPVCVSDTTAPEVRILSPSEGARVTGNNLMLDVHITDAVDKKMGAYALFVGHSRTVPYHPGAERSRIKLSKPTKGVPPATTSIIVEATDGSGNTGSASVNVYLLHDMR